MRSFAPVLVKLTATVIFFTAANVTLLGAEPQLPPSKRNAPKGQTVEFSPAASTTPELPKPTPRATELQNRAGLVPDNGGPASPDGGNTSTPPPNQAPQVSKALADRMLHQLDRRKNWMIPGAQDAELSGMMSEWMKQGFEKDGKETDQEKNESVMERFLKNADQKNKLQQRHGLGESQNDFSGGTENSHGENRLSDLNPKTEGSSGLAGFNFKGALSSERKIDGFEPTEVTRQNMFRSEFNPDKRTGRERELAREREVIQAAEFQQLIRPRSGGTTIGSIIDPINSAPDLTRRELNPTLPKVSELKASEPAARPEVSSFGEPPKARSFGAQDRGLFGVTVPTTPNYSPTPPPAQRLPPTKFRPASSIILEPPKRPY